MKWFGIHRADPEEEVVATPVGKPCGFCEEGIEMGDRGVTFPHIDERGVVEMPYHFECHMRLVIGSVGPLRRRCSCNGGDEGDPPGMTLLQAARAAFHLWQAITGTRDGTNN
jgi:hypothetical protein